MCHKFASKEEAVGDKANRKREYILEKAAAVFAEKGFKNVTMKDIVSACKISRGGVYLYFKSTSEIFQSVLEARAKEDRSLDSSDLSFSARECMIRFLSAQKRELMNPAESLIVATYEYLFEQGQGMNRVEAQRKFDRAVGQLAELIQQGVAEGNFSAEPLVTARSIVLLLEGLRISCTVLDFDGAFLDGQIAQILAMLKGDARG